LPVVARSIELQTELIESFSQLMSIHENNYKVPEKYSDEGNHKGSIS